jgi:hypothetical protein
MGWRERLEELADAETLTDADEREGVRRALLGGLSMAASPDEIGLLIMRHGEYVGASKDESGQVTWTDVFEALESAPERPKVN